jgi:hypothetical protein
MFFYDNDFQNQIKLGTGKNTPETECFMEGGGGGPMRESPSRLQIITISPHLHVSRQGLDQW